MSSKRGRKRNDNLPPNRARDVQRAFRARRAAHLEALEQRVSELELENDTLRAHLGLPPANRPPLGKGPTGKDKPKTPSSQRSHAPLLSLEELRAAAASASSHAVPSSAGSPSSGSGRTDSLSPTMNSAEQAVHALAGNGGWTDSSLLQQQKDRCEQNAVSPVPAAYNSVPISSSYSYSTSPLAQRLSLPSAAAAYQSMAQNYNHTRSDSYSDASSYLDRQYSLSQPSYSSVHDTSQLHNHSPTSAVPSSLQSRGSSNSVQPPISYPHRRSITEPQGYRSVVISPMPHAQQQSAGHVVRIPSPISSMPDSVPSVRSGVYDIESRVGRMS